LVGTSLPSEAVSFKTLAIDPTTLYTAPSAPQKLTYILDQSDAHKVVLSWTAPTSDGGTPVIDYRLWKQEDSNNGILEKQAIVGLTYTVEGLT
jgi:hypothetical protein